MARQGRQDRILTNTHLKPKRRTLQTASAFYFRPYHKSLTVRLLPNVLQKAAVYSAICAKTQGERPSLTARNALIHIRVNWGNINGTNKNGYTCKSPQGTLGSLRMSTGGKWLTAKLMFHSKKMAYIASRYTPFYISQRPKRSNQVLTMLRPASILRNMKSRMVKPQRDEPP